MSTSTRTSDRCAGHTSSATSAAIAKGSPSRRRSASKVSSSPAACSLWRAYQHEHHDRDRLTAEIAPIQTDLRQLLQDASPKSRRTRWHRRFANNLLKVWPALWTFTTVEGVEPTNNPAERALRGPVIHQKLSHGTTSHTGEQFAERALSAAATCRLQRRSLFAYLTELITAHTRGDPFPALT